MLASANTRSGEGFAFAIMPELQTTEEKQTELLRRVANRDHEALAELYDCFSAPLFSLAVYILGDQREAEEVIQDVFVQIWNRAATFDRGLGAPFHWGAGITRNRCIDYLRSRQRRFRLHDKVAHETEVFTTISESAAPEALSDDELARVRVAVKQLPAEQRQAIDLAFFGGLTHAEIAEMLGEPLGTVKARIRRGMMKLRECLNELV
jgi:RNA polymerase sigma-70 factor (ECF subfamily)